LNRVLDTSLLVSVYCL